MQENNLSEIVKEARKENMSIDINLDSYKNLNNLYTKLTYCNSILGTVKLKKLSINLNRNQLNKIVYDLEKVIKKEYKK